MADMNETVFDFGSVFILIFLHWNLVLFYNKKTLKGSY